MGNEPVTLDVPRLPVLGMLELKTSPYDVREAWLMYVSVDPRWQNRGIARRLVAMMAAHLVRTNQRLARSMASDEGTAHIQKTIDSTLNLLGIAWTQTGR